jgi:uncharacterized protein
MSHDNRNMTDRKLVDGVIMSSPVMRLALSRGDQPYLVPLCFGYDGTDLFFHTGMGGQKVEYLQANPRVCFEFEADIRLLPHESTACKWGFAYRTVIGTGSVGELHAPEDRSGALQQIMRRYSGTGSWELHREALARTRVWQIHVHSMTGRQSRHGWRPGGT